MNWNYAFVVVNVVSEWGDIPISWPNCLFGTKLYNTLHPYS